MKTIAPQIRRAPPTPPAAAAPVAVELHIDAVVLHGFSRADGHRATAALQRELTRLVAAHGLPEFSPGSVIAHRDAGAISAGARPEQTGARAARAIFGGLRA